MSYETLKKIYYTEPEKHERIYKERLKSPVSKSIGLEIQQYNHEKKFPAFWLYTEELVLLLERTYKEHNLLQKILYRVPYLVLHQLNLSCIVDEVHSTSAIEGIHSTHRELKEILEGKTGEDHFSSIIKKYDMLTSQDEIELKSCEDIRRFYDEFVHEEISQEKPENKLDGEIFRKDFVDVKSGTGKILHRGLMPEKKIKEAMELALRIQNDENIPVLVRIAIFHYLFVYIHPFYDGNGRTARFISSYYLAKNFHYLPALRLSYVIKQKQKKYYEIIHDSEREVNCGDLTPFIYGFISMFCETIEDIKEKLTHKLEQLRRYENKILEYYPDDVLMQQICFTLLYASTFFGQGIDIEGLMSETGKSRNTIKARLSMLPENYVIIKRNKNNKKNYYKLNTLIFKDL